MLPRRIILAALLAASVFAAGCIKEAARTLGELQAVNYELTKRFGDDVNVHVSQGANQVLTVTFINSPLNNKTSEERGKRAEETAQVVKANYARTKSLKEIWVVFIRQRTRYVVLHYSEGLEGFGFDNEGRPITPPKRLGYVAAPGDNSITAGYAASTDETDISTTANFQLDGEPGNYGVTVLPHFKLPGDARRKQGPAPKAVSFYFASYSKVPRFGGTASYEFIADGTPIMQGKMPFSGSDAEYGYVDLPYPLFRRLIAAKTAAIKLGEKEYPLTPEQLKLLKKMDGYVQD